MSVETVEDNYNRGYDDGVAGRPKASENADYLSGYYDGSDEADEAGFDDADVWYVSDYDGTDWDY